jgi:hypothetical protein
VTDHRGAGRQSWSLDPQAVQITYNQLRDVQTQAGGLGQWFGPLAPMPPIAPPDVAGRAWDFLPGYNLATRPRTYEVVDFETLRALAESYDPLRIIIETRKDQMCRLKWDVRQRVEDPNDPRPAKVSAATQKRIDAIKKFLKKPDGENTFRGWLRVLLEDLYVIDAPSLYCQRDRGGNLLELRYIDGSKIKRVIDYWGRTPRPFKWDGGSFVWNQIEVTPDRYQALGFKLIDGMMYPPAYQEVLKGLPAVDYTTRDLLYKPYNMRPGRVYGMCYSSDTEILTDRGWKLFSKLSLTDKVATRNLNTKAFEWQKPTAIIADDYNGRMLNFLSRSVDIFVTPQHRMLVTATPRVLGGGRDFRWKKGGESIISAGDLARTYNHEIKIPMTSIWIDGVEVREKRFIALTEDVVAGRIANAANPFLVGLNQENERPVSVSGDDYCALLGAYLAEGNIRSAGGIEIAQLKTSKGYATYAELVARVSGGHAQHNGRSFVIPRRGLTKHFRSFGHAHEKFIPDEVMNATPKQLRLFWDHYVLGDGCFESRPSKSGRGINKQDHGVRIVTVSPRMADQLVEIAQKLGWSASVRRRPSEVRSILGRLSHCRESFVLNVRYSQAMGFKVKEAEYKGHVYCVSVPNGIVYVRRNGKPAWCGNSPVEQIITTVNIALRKQQFTLEYYREGSVPDSIIGTPENWTPDQIYDFQSRWDAMLAGNLAQRRRAKFIPGGVAKNYIATKEPPLKTVFDEWLVRVVCFAFSIPPSAFIAQVNRATAETIKETAEEEGLEPSKVWLKELLDEVMEHEFDSPDLEAITAEEVEIDQTKQEVILTGYVSKGGISVNEMRAEMGKPPSDNPAADRLMVLTATGYVPIETNTPEEQQKAAEAQAAMQPPQGAPGASQPGAATSTPPQANANVVAPGVAGRAPRTEVGKSSRAPFREGRAAMEKVAHNACGKHCDSHARSRSRGYDLDALRAECG